MDFLSDGEPNENDGTGSNGISESDTNNTGFGGVGEETHWINFLNANNVVKASAFGIGGLTAANAGNLEPIAWQAPEVAGTFTTAAADSNVKIINDSGISSLGGALVSAVPGSTTGNVLLGNNNAVGGGDDDAFGADGGRILSIQVGAITYTWNGATTITPSSGPAIPAGTSINNILTPDGGTFTFNFASGAWTYTTPASVTAATPNEVFTYTLIDGDGDVSTPTTLTIDLVPVGAAPQIFTEPGGLIPYWTTNSTNTPQTFINRVSFFDHDNPASVRVTFTSPAVDAFNATSGSSVTVGGSGTNTITLDGTIADINAFLAGNKLSWNPSGDGNPISENQADRTISVSIDDNGTTSGGTVVTKNLILDHNTFTFDANSDTVNFVSWNLNQGNATDLINALGSTDTVVTSWKSWTGHTRRRVQWWEQY